MKRVILWLSYDGTDFCGWQTQPNKRTVQQTVEEGIFAVTGERVSLTGSGRTDAGVHAMGQIADFLTESSIPPEKFAVALSTVLPPDVKALKSYEGDIDFNARRDAKKKTYVYALYEGKITNPLFERYAVMTLPLDIDKMRKCAGYIVGEHDFKCFQSNGTPVKSTVRTVYELNIKRQGDFIFIEVTGSGFLYNMVRLITGALVKVGLGKITPEDVKKAIENKKRDNLFKTMPSKGLCLKEVIYFK